ncbi:DoxX family protein [soil metagenome]
MKTLSRYTLALLLIAAGSLHFIRPQFYVQIMPPDLPWHLELVYLSGLIEVLLGILLLIPRWSRLAAWGVIALLIAVFPANLYLFQHQEILPAPAWVHLLRLPLQGVLIYWAWTHTRQTTSGPVATSE